jgi:hypothetical protein
LFLKSFVPHPSPVLQAFDTTANPSPKANPVLSTTTPAKKDKVSYTFKITNLVPAHNYDILVQPMYSRTASSGKKEVAAGPGAAVSATTGSSEPAPTPVPIVITCSSPPGPVQALQGVAISSSTVQVRPVWTFTSHYYSYNLHSGMVHTAMVLQMHNYTLW